MEYFFLFLEGRAQDKVVYKATCRYSLDDENDEGYADLGDGGYTKPGLIRNLK